MVAVVVVTAVGQHSVCRVAVSWPRTVHDAVPPWPELRAAGRLQQQPRHRLLRLQSGVAVQQLVVSAKPAGTAAAAALLPQSVGGLLPVAVTQLSNDPGCDAASALLL